MFFEARRDTPQSLDFIEEVLEVGAFLIEGLGEAMANLAADHVGNVRCRALGLDPVSDPIRVVILVAGNDARGHVVKAGRTLSVCRSDVFAVAGGVETLCGTAQMTLMRLADRPDGPAD